MKRYDYLYGRVLHPSLSISNMTDTIVYEVDNINALSWINSVPSKDKDMCIKMANKVAKKYIGVKTTQAWLEKFIRELHGEIKKEIESRGN